MTSAMTESHLASQTNRHHPAPFKSLALSKDQLVQKPSSAASLSHRYEQLLHSEKFTDCHFQLEGDVHIKCHKLILSAASSVFEAMFYGPMRETQETIDVHDISAEIFKVLVSYIYRNEVDFEQLTLEQTIELYYCAEKYLLSDLIDVCLLEVTRKLRFSNILPALELSVCIDLSNLLEVCLKFFGSCCLADPQYHSYIKTNYLHVSKECIKTIIASNKDLKGLLWFVSEWCQHECNELGLHKSDYGMIIDDLQLKECNIMGDERMSTKVLPQSCVSIERCYFKACRPYVIDYENHEWKLFVKSDRFIALHGIILHSRLTPNVINSRSIAHIAFPSEYNESLSIEISAPSQEQHQQQQYQEQVGNSDGEESDHDNEHEHEEFVMEQDQVVPAADSNIIWRHSITKQPTKYNCDLNIAWNEAVTLSPDVEYQIKLFWQPAAANSAEYPCSLLSNKVNGIQFRDYNAHCGSLIKGLRFINLV